MKKKIIPEVEPDNNQDIDPIAGQTIPKNKDLLAGLQKKFTLKEIANKLNLAVGTVQRWIELDNIPHHYTFDLLRLSLSNEEYNNINYSKFKSSEKDQFFTPPDIAKKCYDKFIDITKINGNIFNEYTFIEPSAGDGSFLKALPQNCKSIGLDIEPRYKDVIKCDYLSWKPTEDIVQKYVVIGNPPFGLRGHTALNFINHSYEFADYVAFILPQLFESDGKGSPRKRVYKYNLIYSEKVSGMYHTPDKTLVDINGVFQIWSKHTCNDELKIKSNDNDKIKVYSLSDGGTVATTRNKKMLDKCDIYLPSTCFGKESMKLYGSFEELPNRKGYGLVFLKDKENMIEKSKKIDWSKISFLSTNSAYNLRTTLIIEAFN
jgi:transcriptional regulator with XRE-family HTH domain